MPWHVLCSLLIIYIMKKILLLTDKPFAQVAIDGIQKVVTDAGYELKLCEKIRHRHGSCNKSCSRCRRIDYPKR